jgi:hypothetical protein
MGERARLTSMRVIGIMRVEACSLCFVSAYYKPSVFFRIVSNVILVNSCRTDEEPHASAAKLCWHTSSVGIFSLFFFEFDSLVTAHLK